MTKLELYENFAKNIEIERIKKGYTQKYMAKRIGISLSKYKVLISKPLESNVDIFLSHKLYGVIGKTTIELCEDHIPELEIILWIRNLRMDRQEILRYLREFELKNM